MNDRDEQRVLARELRAQARSAQTRQAGFDEVRRRAGRIRLRRRLAGGAVAAAVLAVAVPAGLTLATADRAQPPVVAPTPTPSRTDHATPRPDGSYRLVMSGLTRGPDPRIPYLYGRTLNLPGGKAVELSDAYSDIVAFGPSGQWLALTGEVGTGNGAVLENGTVVQRLHLEHGFALSAGAGFAGYVRVGPDGADTLVSTPVHGSGEEHHWTFPVGTTVRPVGYVGPDSLVWESAGARPVVGVASPTGRSTTLTGFLGAAGTSPADGLVSVQLSSSPSGSCWAVVQPSTGRDPLWRTCDFALGGFSPDGHYVLGTEAYGDGLGHHTVAILDARTGAVVADYRADRDTPVRVSELTWEDDGHVLAVANEGTTWRVLRLDTQGTLTQASDPAVADATAFPFHLSTQP